MTMPRVCNLGDAKCAGRRPTTRSPDEVRDGQSPRPSQVISGLDGQEAMNGILAQAAALAAHAKASRVDARAGGDAEYWKHHSTFKYVKSVNFGVRRRRLFRTAFETDATEPS